MVYSEKLAALGDAAHAGTSSILARTPIVPHTYDKDALAAHIQARRREGAQEQPHSFI